MKFIVAHKEKGTGPRPRLRLGLISVAVGLAALFAVACTSNSLGLNCDEPNYYNSCLQQLAWFEQAFEDFSAGRWSAPFSPEVIDRYWSYQPIFNVHPPFYKLCSSLTLVLFQGWLGPMDAFRLAPAIMFSILVALLFLTVGRRYGIPAGLWAAGAFAMMPRVFAHAHFGCADMPLTLLWFASAVSFYRALNSRGWAVAFALVYGLALATKFTALVIPLPLVLYVLLFRRFSRSAWPVGLALVLSPLIMVGLNPQWWHSSLERVYFYLVDSANRSDYLCIPTYYLGIQYYFYLPWHHSFILTLFTVQPLVLAGFIYGFWRTARHPLADPWMSHILLHWLSIMFIMMLPSSPGHDGVRLFLPSFAFLAVISALGFKDFVSRALPWVLKRIPRAGQRIRKTSGAWLLLGAMLVPSAVILARAHPYELSYFNCLAGGVSGAEKLGMETTYMWETFNDTSCAVINRTLPDSAGVFTMNNPHFQFLQRLGKIGPSLKFDNERFDYILQYNRQGMFTDLDWVLLRRGTPVAELEVDGVRLFALFQYPRVFEEILARLDSSKSAQSFYEKAVIYQWTGRPNRAYLELVKYLELEPGDFDASLRIAEYLLDNDSPDMALDYLRRANDIEKDPKIWYYNLGLAYSRLGKIQMANASFRQALESRTRHSAPLLIDADIHYRMERLEEAAGLYARVLRGHRSDEIACQMLGLINHRLGKTETAKHYYRKLLDLTPRHFETLYNLGLLESEQGNPGLAEEYFTRALEADPRNPAVNFQLGKLLAESGRSGPAEKHFWIVLEENPDDVQAHSALANLFLEDSNRHAEAIEHFLILARLDPESAEYIEQNFIQPLREELARKGRTQP